MIANLSQKFIRKVVQERQVKTSRYLYKATRIRPGVDRIERAPLSWAYDPNCEWEHVLEVIAL